MTGGRFCICMVCVYVCVCVWGNKRRVPCSLAGLWGFTACTGRRAAASPPARRSDSRLSKASGQERRPAVLEPPAPAGFAERSGRVRPCGSARRRVAARPGRKSSRHASGRITSSRSGHARDARYGQNGGGKRGRAVDLAPCWSSRRSPVLPLPPLPRRLMRGRRKEP